VMSPEDPGQRGCTAPAGTGDDQHLSLDCERKALKEVHKFVKS